MKRDIKLNMSNLRAILYKINEYKSELEVIESASTRFLETIKEQDSKAYDRLATLWEKNVTLNERDLREKLETISKILNNYICDMESYITPNNPSAMMRVDRNDIWRNCGQIEQNTVYDSYFDEILCDTSSSFADYKKCFVYNPFEDEETNNARKSAQQAEEEAERKRREANYAQLENFRTTLRGKMQGSLKTSVDNIWKMYEEVIIPFENTDDDYKKKLDGYYDEWSDIGDKFNDVIDVIADVGSGFGHAATDLLTGIGNLLSGVGKVLGWLALQIPIFEECGLVPETLEETWEQELKETWTGIKAILSEPEDVLGAIAQSVIDTADEKGVAYSVGYVTTDIVSGIVLDKGLGKVSKLGKADDVVKYVDEVAESASKAGEYADDLTNGIGKVLGGKGLKTELTQDIIDEIVAMPKGSRPEPSTYLTQEYIDAHLAQFDGGVSVIQTDWAYSRYSEMNGFVGVPDDNTLFVMPRNLCDDIVTKANGDISIIEVELGFPEGYFSDGGGLVRIDVNDISGLNIRIPSGNETGANSLWMPGGYTSGGVPEAVTNTIPLSKTHITTIDVD